ncbi:MAG: hypothetical protein RBR63_05550, partial [Methanosarcina vacuolata]|nr:hypothetical protein [Methanosarcina vacuolata]
GKTLEYDLALFNPCSELLLTDEMADTGKNGRQSLKDMFEKYASGSSIDELLSACENVDIKEMINNSSWDENDKKKALIASVYYRSVENAKGIHAFILEKQLRDNLDKTDDREDFKVPDYLRSCIEYISED